MNPISLIDYTQTMSRLRGLVWLVFDSDFAIYDVALGMLDGSYYKQSNLPDLPVFHDTHVEFGGGDGG